MVPIVNEDISFRKNIVFYLTEDETVRGKLLCEGDWIIAFQNAINLFKILGYNTSIKNESIKYEPAEEYTFINIQIGNSTNIEKIFPTMDLGKTGHKYWKFLMMVEIPVNVILIEDFIKVGIDGISIGSNDLTMLIEGTDRDNSEVAQEFDERSPAVLWALKRVIRKCSAAGITTSICGQAPSEYEDLVKKLVRWGITAISVNPDAIDRVRGVVAEAEKDI